MTPSKFEKHDDMSAFTITTLGCKVNRYESEALAEQLINRGWHVAERFASAGLCIINTCAVTKKASTQSRQAARRAVRENPRAVTVVTGCYAQISPEVFSTMEGVRYVVGNACKNRIVELIAGNRERGSVRTLVEDLSSPCPFQDMPLAKFGNRTRPFLKIQDGCDAFCSYCIIPYARGRSRSLSPEVINTRLGRLKESGYEETVLCGINLGRYGADLEPPTTLHELMHAIDGPKGMTRLRISSIEPGELSEDLIRLLAVSEHVCPHLHIPMQSGDDDVLKAMNRPYSSTDYKDLIYHIVDLISDVAIGLDVLVGFPGETEEAFERTCKLVEELPVSYLHVFPFSRIQQTAAANLPGVVPPEEIKKRCAYVRGIGQTKRAQFYEKAVGSTCEVLIEGKRDRTTGHLKGLTRNYIPVLVEGYDAWMNRLVQARIVKLESGRVFAEYLATT
jgi:threonylcarbamoyladenosine tRNA methylthiotransferase MtaB